MWEPQLSGRPEDDASMKEHPASLQLIACDRRSSELTRVCDAQLEGPKQTLIQTHELGNYCIVDRILWHKTSSCCAAP